MLIYEWKSIRLFMFAMLVVFALMSCGETAGGGGPRERAPVAVEVEPVRRMEIKDIGRFSGSLEPVSRFAVSPRISGRLVNLTVDIGDEVKRGILIAELDDAEYVQAVIQARADLAVSRARMEQTRSALVLAERELERRRTLREKNVISDSDMDQAQAEYDAALAENHVTVSQVERSQAALESAEVRLSYTRIKALWKDGSDVRVVGERFVDEGDMLSSNEPIVSILDNRIMIAEIHVIERDYHKLRNGQEAVIRTDAAPEKSFQGRIARIAPLLDEASRQARVEVLIPNPEQILKPGMFVRVEIEFARHPDAIVVPSSALARRNGDQGVFLIDRTTMSSRFVPVRTGIQEQENVEILEPEITGEVVVLGHHLLEDGAPVILPDVSPNQGKDTLQ